VEKIAKKVKIILKEMTKKAIPKTIPAKENKTVCAKFQIVIEENKI
jgi:hypothetical protein